MSQPQRPLHKQKTWSPDSEKEKLWRRKKKAFKRHEPNGVDDYDIDDIKSCIELGFGFHDDSLVIKPKLSNTLPALGLYCAINRQFSDHLSRTSSSSSSIASDISDSTTCSSVTSLIDPSDEPERVKAKLKQWARLVACWVQQSGEPKLIFDE